MRIKCAAVDIRFAHYVGHGDALEVLLLHQPRQCLPQQLFRSSDALILHFCHGISLHSYCFFRSISVIRILTNIYNIFVRYHSLLSYLIIAFVILMYYTITRKEILHNIYF